MDDDRLVAHIKLDFVIEAALFNERFGYANSARIADGYECRFHGGDVITL